MSKKSVEQQNAECSHFISTNTGVFKSMMKSHRNLVDVDVIDFDTGEVVTQTQDIRFEYPDPTPLEVPLALRLNETTDDKIKRLMAENRAWNDYLNRAEESLDEAEDFDVVDDMTGYSPHELDGMSRSQLLEVRQNFLREHRFRRALEQEALNDDKLHNPAAAAEPPAIESVSPSGEDDK